MVHNSFFMLMVLIHWVKAYIPKEKNKTCGGGGGKEIGL
jgi:hypothetical protein